MKEKFNTKELVFIVTAFLLISILFIYKFSIDTTRLSSLEKVVKIEEKSNKEMGVSQIDLEKKQNIGNEKEYICGDKKAIFGFDKGRKKTFITLFNGDKKIEEIGCMQESCREPVCLNGNIVLDWFWGDVNVSIQEKISFDGERLKRCSLVNGFFSEEDNKLSKSECEELFNYDFDMFVEDAVYAYSDGVYNDFFYGRGKLQTDKKIASFLLENRSDKDVFLKSIKVYFEKKRFERDLSLNKIFEDLKNYRLAGDPLLEELLTNFERYLILQDSLPYIQNIKNVRISFVSDEIEQKQLYISDGLEFNSYNNYIKFDFADPVNIPYQKISTIEVIADILTNENSYKSVSIIIKDPISLEILDEKGIKIVIKEGNSFPLSGGRFKTFGVGP
ncbi:hypothetical protein ACFLY7_01715 [Patescibacteria group bacterium]